MPSNTKKTSITAPNKAACIHRHIHKHVYMSICTLQPRYKERVLFTQTFPSFDVQYEYANQQAYFGNLSHSFSAYQRPVYMSSSSLLACSLISVTIWAGIRTSRLALGLRRVINHIKDAPRCADHLTSFSLKTNVTTSSYEGFNFCI